MSGVEHASLGRRSFVRGAMLVSLAGTTTLSASCGTARDEDGANSAGRDPTQSPAAISVRDQRGEKVSLAGPATRIVTLPMPAAALLVAVDQDSDHLAGMHEASWAAMRDGIMGEMFPETLDIEHGVAGQDFAPNVESVLGLQPDLVVQWANQGDDLIAPLENAGLQVAGLTYGGQQELSIWITFFAAILGKPERGAQMNARMDASLKSFEADAAARSGPRPRILYFNRFADGLKVAGNETYNDFYIDLIGGTNVASGDDGAPGSGMVGVEREQVLAWDPDIILLGNFDSAVPDDLYSDQVWAGLYAVQARRVYKVPLGGYRWDPPSQESPLMWRWLSQVAFPPDPSAGPSLREDIVEEFAFLYDREPTPAQIDTMLWSEENASSAHYGQFHAS